MNSELIPQDVLCRFINQLTGTLISPVQLTEIMLMAHRITSLLSFYIILDQRTTLGQKSSMHDYFWNIEAFETFKSNNLWLVTKYLLDGQC